MDMGRILVQSVSKTYPDVKGDPFTALNNVSFTWKQGENIAVIGESGSGKSTLARLLIGIERPTSGSIHIDNQDIKQWSYHRWRRERRNIQAVFQDATGTLNAVYSVRRNVEEALCNLTSLTKSQRRERMKELMELTGMSEKLFNVPTRQLSGGEQRRLSLLRALAVHPSYLILDEVTSGLDLLSADAVLTVLERYHIQHGCSYFFITHDKQNAYRLAHHIYVMEKGEIVGTGHKPVQS